MGLKARARARPCGSAMGHEMEHSDSKMNLCASAGAKDERHSEAARRALVEAEGRRRIAEKVADAARKEFGGRGGLDPARYGDWEVKGIASDF